MDQEITLIDLNANTNETILNPLMPEEDAVNLIELSYEAEKNLNLKSHVWVATSGSTALSASATKLVAISKDALKASARAVNEHLKVTEDDVWAQVLPHFHVGGIGVEVRAELSWSSVIMALKSGKWHPEYFIHVIEEDGCTLSTLVPTQVYDLVQKNLKCPKSMRAIVVGGGALSVDLYRQARALGWPLLPSYGMSETASQIATASLESLAQDEFPDIELLSHAQARTNAEAYLEVRAESLFTTYAQNTESGIKIWKPMTGDGWFITEDKGQVEGRVLKIFGRSKDYIKIGGEALNVADLRVQLENVVSALNPQWLPEVTLIDMPSDRLGSEIHLVTTLAPEIAESISEAYAQKVLPIAKVRKIHQINEIPRSELGKILWGQLRNRL